MTDAAIALLMGDMMVPGGEELHLADREIAARAAAGDATAFRELYVRHRQPVYAVVARMIEGEADREELLQDVFTQVYLSLGGFRGDAKLSTWIHRIAVNVTFQHIRRKGRRVRLQLVDATPAEDLSIETRTTSQSPEDDASLRDRKVAVERALARLSPKKRIVLVLSDFEGYTSNEIAEIVGASSLTVRTRLFYARKEFYREISREAAFADLAAGEARG
ncbi:MAG: sigma-70 family RNA polymerase sigma factor [Proteobacteria bacterium]|jgi:RNA polymerase sigma-70 factor (ECF subfamily)|nr:sigma-70 family RNA polymerase sigma factor [Pseudomonadota bacterium]